MIYDKTLGIFAKSLPVPLYVVGGFTRNYLIDRSVSCDVDLCGILTTQSLEIALKEVGAKVVATYPRTGTIVFTLNGQKYEYTTFRKDGYSAGGKHTPDSVEFTDDILEDALRRDFKCNAVYYDLKNDEFIDPLGGIEDIKNKVLDTVKSADEVFSHDGLRLMRLARFSGELGFTPTCQVVEGARKNARNIKDISPERIWTELQYICHADTKHPFSPGDGHYRALKVLDRTRVLDEIFPSLAMGRGLVQRKDYHDYDVLEHSLRCVLYADKKVRISALFHDVAKSKLMLQKGNAYGHDKTGSIMAKEILKGLKADNKTIDKSCRIIGAHMLDVDCKMKESKVRSFILSNADIFEEVLMLKQADFSACKDDLSICPTVKKWKEIYNQMKKDGTPFTVKELAVNSGDVMNAGFNGEDIGKVLRRLLKDCQNNPKENVKAKLLQKIAKFKEKSS